MRSRHARGTFFTLSLPLTVSLLSSACSSATEPAAQAGATSEDLVTTTLGTTTTDPLAGAPRSVRLLVIVPQLFQQAMQPLIDHKNATGMPAWMITMESVHATGGFPDDARKLKLVIQRAHEQLGVQYVLLGGDQSFIPARQVTSLPPPGAPDGTITRGFQPTDLYYANLYVDHDPAQPVNAHGGFAEWDDDGDGFYDVAYGPTGTVNPPTALDAAHYNPDHVDAFADVAVGRVPANGSWEIDRYVRKVIGYEKGQLTAPNALPYAWVADGAYGGADGLVAQIQQRSYLDAPGAAAQRFYGINYNQPGNPALPAGYIASNGGTISSLFYGTKWITYVGHGWQGGWDGWGDGDLDAVTNTGNLPIVFAAACESGAFGPLAPAYEYQGIDGLSHRYTWDDKLRTAWDADQNNIAQAYPWTPQTPAIYQPERDAVRGMVASALFHPDGSGAIAYMGDTVVTQNGKPAWFAGYLMRSYAGGAQTLGDAFLAGQRGYWNDERNSGDFFEAARVYLTVMALSGDPSLRLHGVGGSGPHPEPAWSTHSSIGGYVTSIGAAEGFTGNVEAIVGGGERLLWEREEPWSRDWQPLFAPTDVGTYAITGAPAIATEAPDERGIRFLHPFALTNHGVIANALETSGAMLPAYPYVTQWSPNPPGETFVSSPGIGQRADGGLEVFATSASGNVWINYQTQPTWNVPLSSRPWSGWQTFGAPPSGAKGQPGVGVNGGGGLEVFVVANDGHLYGRYKPTQYGQWSDWFPLGGACGTDPAVARNVDGRLEIFLADQAHHLCHIWQQPYPMPPWSGWDCTISGIGGYITSKPAVANNADGSLNVFFRGGEGNLWHVYQTFDSRLWGPWLNMGGALDDSIGLTNVVATRDAHSRIQVYYRSAANGALMQTTQLTP